MKLNKKKFSLIELLIVIGIMGALAALILPSFSDTESAAKDTACDYNQAGTLRYLSMFKAANGVYPSGFHTGAENKTATQTVRLDGSDTETALTACATHNFEKGSTPGALTADQVTSLKDAGIVTLASGREIAQAVDTGTHVYFVNAGQNSGKYWTEELDPVTGAVKDDGAPLTFRSAALGDIATVGQLDNDAPLQENLKVAMNMRSYTLDESNNVQFSEGKFKIVPLYVAPTIDWEHYYSDGPNDSKVSIAMAGKCPWGEGGQARYYIAFFKVYDNGEPAKLLCTSCPDCGILEGDLF